MAFTFGEKKPLNLLVEAIESTKTSLDIAIYALTHPEIVKTVQKAIDRGVAVRLITDRRQSLGKAQQVALRILQKSGVKIKLNKHRGLMHLKTAIIDKEYVTVGSFNFTRAANQINDEVIMLIRDLKITRNFQERFEQMWNDVKRFELYELVENTVSR